MMTKVKTHTELAAMREAGAMLAQVLELLERELTPGQSTKDLSDIAARELDKLGGQPSFKGYQGFPDIICISVNDEVVHGIPNKERIIQDGDIVSLDFGVTVRGMITDSAMSVIAGRPKQKGHIELVKNTAEALQVGINELHDQVRTGDIGSAIETFLKNHRYGIVRDLVGHGVGHELHEDPNIPNYGRPNTGPWLQAGMTIAIEPMVTLGTDHVYLMPDGWTIKTADGSMAAHFEHSILITEDGAEIITKRSNEA
ncbi:MAG TPA: type I methionyl aminopeptidase [Candidatus Saccharimonadales bacterium]|nr:type I methionyl aminopeptidase [Candidatus Saccharimonadales bacterium]